MQRFFAIVLMVWMFTTSVLANEWTEFRSVPCEQSVKAWDLSYDGSDLAAIFEDENAYFLPLPKRTSDPLNPKYLLRWANAVTFKPQPRGGLVVLGSTGARYDYSGKKEAEYKLGWKNIFVDKTANGYFLTEILNSTTGGGFLHIWSPTARHGSIHWRKGNKAVISFDGNHLITWDQRMLTSYTDPLRDREPKKGTQKAPPRPPSEWTWFKRGPVLEEAAAMDCSHDGKVVLLALRQGRVLARLPEGDKIDSDLLEEYKQKYGNDWPYAKPLMLESLTTSSSPESEGLKNTAGAVNPKGEWIAVAKEVESRGQVFVWHHGGVPVMLGPLEVPPTQLQFMDDGRLVSAAGNELAVWSLASGTVQRINLTRFVKNFVVSGDGKTIAVLGHDGKEDGIVLFREKDAPTVTSK